MAATRPPDPITGPSSTDASVAVPESYEEMAQRLIGQYGRTEGKRLIREMEPQQTQYVMPSDEDVAWAQKNTPPEAPDPLYPFHEVKLDGTTYRIQVGADNTLPRSVWEAYKHSRRLPIVRVPGVFTRSLDDGGDAFPEIR